MKINEINSLNGILLKNNSYESVISIINNFEKDIILFNSNKTLDEKEIIVNKINTYDFAKYSLEEHQDLEGTKLTKNYSYEKSIKFLFQKLSESITLPSPEKQCCFMGECISCGSKTPKYPILLIHGHGFSDKSSAENSLYIFDDLQNKLEEEGYIKAGEISLISQRRPNPGLLSIGGNSVSVKGSYYFDTFKDANNLIIVQSNSDSIDTYAIRLKGIIEDLMYETNQTKVVLITHSMGGLVARRYIQIFGENNVYKLIEVTVPNHGVKGKIKSLCNVFGANAECKDLSSDSLFINKLNSQSPLSIDVENIIAVGCDMEEGNGDGIVLNESAYLSWANNHYIQGSCNGLNFMHGEVLDTSKYPEVYEIIKNAL